MKMAELNLDDRPREKMAARGAAALSTAELLAVIIRTGTVDLNAVDVARNLLAGADGSLLRLSRQGLREFCARKGIGREKALSVLAALELGRRMLAEAPQQEGLLITSADDVFNLMSPLLKGLDHEQCWALYLNRGARLTGKECLSRGNDISTVLDAAEVARKAVAAKARRIILVHNHPSGDPTPSPQDIRLTGEVKRALGLFGIVLVDHIILSDGAFFSFSREVVSAR